MPQLKWVNLPPFGSQVLADSQPTTTSGDVYWVSFARSDTPKAYELYSAYKTEAEANKASQEIRDWAGRTGWKVADIQIEKDSGPAKPDKKAATDAEQGPNRPKDKLAESEKDLLAKTYNPPANVALLPKFPTAALPTASGDPSVASTGARAPVGPGSPLADRRTAIDLDIARMKQSGLLKTARDTENYLRERMKNLGQEVATYNGIVQTAKKIEAVVEEHKKAFEVLKAAKEVKEYIEKIEKAVEGNTKDLFDPYTFVRKLYKTGLDALEAMKEKMDPVVKGPADIVSNFLQAFANPWGAFTKKVEEGSRKP